MQNMKTVEKMWLLIRIFGNRYRVNTKETINCYDSNISGINVVVLK